MFHIINLLSVGMLFVISSSTSKNGPVFTHLLLTPEIIFTNGVYWLAFQVQDVNAVDTLIPSVSLNVQLPPSETDSSLKPCWPSDHIEDDLSDDNTVDSERSDIYKFKEVKYLIHKCENKTCLVQRVAIIETLFVDEADVPQLLLANESNLTSNDSVKLIHVRSDAEIPFTELLHHTLKHISQEYWTISLIGISVIFPAVLILTYYVWKHITTVYESLSISRELVQNIENLLDVIRDMDKEQQTLRKSMTDMSQRHRDDLNLINDAINQFRKEIQNKESNIEERLLDDRLNYASETIKNYSKLIAVVSQFGEDMTKEKEQSQIIQQNMKDLHCRLDSTYEIVDLIEHFIIHTALFLDFNNLPDSQKTADKEEHQQNLRRTYDSLINSYRTLRMKLFSKRSDFTPPVVQGQMGDYFRRHTPPTASTSTVSSDCFGTAKVLFSGGKWYRLEDDRMVEVFPKKTSSTDSSATMKEYVDAISTGISQIDIVSTTTESTKPQVPSVHAQRPQTATKRTARRSRSPHTATPDMRRRSHSPPDDDSSPRVSPNSSHSVR